MKVVYVFGGIIILKTAFYENEYSIVDLLSKSQFAMFYERHRPQARIVLWTNHHQSLTPSTPPPPPKVQGHHLISSGASLSIVFIIQRFVQQLPIEKIHNGRL